MKTIFKSIALASLGLAVLLSCTKNEPVAGTADGNGLMEISVTGVLGEYKAVEGTKASLVNNIRVGWEKDEKKKDTVLVFHKERQKYLGYLVATVWNSDDRTATLSGTITPPEGANKTLVFVHGTGLNLSGFTVGATTESVTLVLSNQSEKTPFMVYGTAPYIEASIKDITVDFSFATSVVSTYAAGLPASTAVTQATLSGINTKCVLTISTSGAITVSGDGPGTITKSAGIGSTNAQGQVLFEIAVPESEAATSDRSIVFTIGSETYTTAFSNAAVESGKAYSAMSENHSPEYLAFATPVDSVYLGSSKTLTAKIYPLKSNQTMNWTSSDETIATVDEATGKVTGVTLGTATITATSQDDPSIKATCTVTVVDYVVMKMGTGESAYTLKWKIMNLGATTVATSYTTCYGDLYQWGSVETLYTGFPWTSATAGSFVWKDGKSSSFVTSNREYTDNDATLPDDRDVVKVKYPGTGWRMPTSWEFQALYDACTSQPGGSTSTTAQGVYWCDNYDGVAGVLFCDGTNKLFFPAAGRGNGTALENAGSLGGYWSSSLYSGRTDFAYGLSFSSGGGVFPQGGCKRFYGFSVRPVSD